MFCFKFKILIILLFLTVSGVSSGSVFDHFITVSGSKLMQGDQEYRFISWNIPNINFVEDEMAFSRRHEYGLPTAFEIRDALVSVKQMGGRAVRAYTFPVRSGEDAEGVPKYILAPGEFNERAFVTMDTVLAIANEAGVRLILPLLNEWKWMGGRPQYAAFRGKSENVFYTDQQLIEDFKQTIHYVLTRKNTVTGVEYRDDKAILCWETGNELRCPHAWTREIASFIKDLDSNHLLMDGYYAIDSQPVREESIQDPNIDILSSHHYSTDPEKIFTHIQTNLDMIQSRKPYILGEFGFVGTPVIEKYLDWVMHKPVSGALIWSLRYHRHQGGFYWHSEPLGGGVFKAYHWPGFDSGEEYDEKRLVDLMREKAFEIQGLDRPTPPVPDAPDLLPIDHAAHISWRGSAGASAYDVQRSLSAKGPWTTAGYHISDAAVQYMPLYHDADARPGITYYYRVIAKNPSGCSQPSNVMSVKAGSQALVDEMAHLNRLYHSNGNWSVATDNDRSFKEDMQRLSGEPGDELIYRVPGRICGWNIYTFTQTKEVNAGILLSADAEEYEPVESGFSAVDTGEGYYGYWRPVLFRQNELQSEKRYIKIKLTAATQIGRIEIFYE